MKKENINKKTIKYVFVIMTILSIIFVNNIYKVKADSGFDASYDSGGSSYDSGGSSYNSSSSSSDSEMDAKLIIFMISIPLAIFIYIKIGEKLFKKDKNKKYFPKWYFILYITIYSLLVTITLGFIYIAVSGGIIVLLFFTEWINLLKPSKKNKIMTEPYLSETQIKEKLGETFDINNFYHDSFKIYKDVQIAWMNKDLEPVRNVLTDEMFNMYKTQLMTLITKKETNIMTDISCVANHIIEINNKDNGKEEIIIQMEVECLDYIIDDKTKKVLRGNDRAINHYVYKLTFVRTVEEQNVSHCPNCGAKLENAASTKCPYCNTIINKNSNKFVLSDKKMISQTIERYK